MRSVFHNRVTFLNSLLFFAGTVSSFFFPQTLRWYLAAALFALAALPVIFRKAKPYSKPLFAAIAVGVLALSYLCTALHAIPTEKARRYLDTEQPVTLTVTDITYRSESVTFAEAKLNTVGEERCHAKIRLTVYGNMPFAVGSVLSGTGTFQDFVSTESFDAVSYARAHGQAAEILLTNGTVTGQKTTLSALTSSWRAKLSDILRNRVGGDEGELSCAILLGEREGVPDVFSRNMREIGTAHMLALSGLHLSLLVFGLDKLLYRLLRLGKTARTVILCFVCVFYMALTGFSSSVLRAGAMMLLTLLTYLLQEDHDSLTALGMGTAILCLIRPCIAVDPAFWLSFSATFGILLLGQRVSLSGNRKASFGRKIFDYFRLSLFVTAAASLFTLPIVAFLYGTFPLISPLANLVLIPIMQLTLYSALLALLLGFIPGFSFPARLFGTVLIRLSSLFSSIPRQNIAVDHPFVLAVILLLILYCAILLIFSDEPKFKLIRPAVALLVAAVLIGGFYGVRYLYERNRLSVDYLTYETTYSDFLVLHTGGNTVIVDRSGGSYSTLSSAWAALEKEHIHQADGYVLTEYRANTVEKMPKFLATRRIGTLYLPVPQTDEQNESMRSLLSAAQNSGMECRLYTVADGVTCGKIRITFPTDDPDNTSTDVIHIGFGGKYAVYISRGALDRRNFSFLSDECQNAEAIFWGTHGKRGTVFSGGQTAFSTCPCYASSEAFFPFSEDVSAAFSPRARICLRAAR